LNQIETKAEGIIMDAIEGERTAFKIRGKMFIFADLLTIDDKGMQMVIKELSSDILTLALKSAEDNIKEKFLTNMSERAAEMLAEDLRQGAR
jgi:flagellar motor switch protein FliG